MLSRSGSSRASPRAFLVTGLSDVVAEVIFVVALLLIRPLVLLALARRSGLPIRSTIEAVTLLGHAGELSVVVAIVGIELGHIDDGTLGVVASVIVVTTALYAASGCPTDE